jgi:hypothetical protein
VIRSARAFVAAAPLGACDSLFVRCADPVSPRLFPALFNNAVGIEYSRKSNSRGCCRAISAWTVVGSGKPAVPKHVFHQATSFHALFGYASLWTKLGLLRISSARRLIYSRWLLPRFGRRVGGASLSSFKCLLADLVAMLLLL